MTSRIFRILNDRSVRMRQLKQPPGKISDVQRASLEEDFTKPPLLSRSSRSSKPLFYGSKGSLTINGIFYISLNEAVRRLNMNVPEMIIYRKLRDTGVTNCVYPPEDKNITKIMEEVFL